MNPAAHVEQRSAAVARLDGDGELDHRPAVHLAPAGHHPGNDAVRQSLRIAHRDDGLPVFERGRVAQLQRRQPLGVDAQDGEIELAVGGVDGRHFVMFAVGGLDADGPALADDVAIGGDKSVRRHHEAGAQSLAFAIPSAHADDHD